jgi:tRNA/rRNA methyltransferase
MSNFGFFDLRLVNPYRVAFDEARSGLNAGEVLANAREFPSLPEAVADCTLVVGATGTSARDLKTAVYRLEQGAPRLREASAPQTVALVFGSEKHGLSREEISHCHYLVHIPTRPAHDSMNLGQAVAICLYELVRSEESSRASTRVPRRATAETLDRLHASLFEVLKESGYLEPRVAESATEKLRQLLLRLNPRAVDANLLLGMVKQISLALRRPEIREKALRRWPAAHSVAPEASKQDED